MLKLYYFRVLDFFGGKTSKRKEEAEVGELTVSGQGETEIQLDSLPRFIEMKFRESEHHVPCDPHHDKLHHEVRRIHHKYFLVIKWHVASVREIVWAIYF